MHMKANRRLRTPVILAAALAATLTASCSDHRVVPSPTPTTTARPFPSPRPVPARPSADWRDAPVTPGNWTWAMEGNISVARFAGNALVLQCDRNAGTVTLLREAAGLRDGAAGGQVPITVMTTTLTRGLTGTARALPAPTIAVTLPARDGLLDAMAFSRGRFAIETAGLAPLYVPSWPEVSRVIEDCR